MKRVLEATTAVNFKEEQFDSITDIEALTEKSGYGPVKLVCDKDDSIEIMAFVGKERIEPQISESERFHYQLLIP